MSIQRAVLLIADIGGYTQFMKVHRWSLSHAQDVVARLLESVIDAARSPLRLAKLEGDAALFYAPLKEGKEPDVVDLARQVADIRRSFLDRRADLDINRVCTCDGCVQVGSLKLKFVVHAGEVAEQRVKNWSELAGVDVIIVHRMLKNEVPVSEYVLMTEPVYRGLDAEVRGHAKAIEHDFEGIGKTPTWYVDLNAIAAHLPQALRRSGPGRVWEQVKKIARTTPYWVGWKKPCDGFRNMPDQPGIPAASPSKDASAA